MSDTPTGLPSPEQAEELLREAAERNPGPWEAHSRNTAEAARRIAEHCPGMDSQAAHTMGLLHDIGRRYGFTGMRHVLDGYRFLIELGFDRAARICLTHTFEAKSVEYAPGPWDCTPEEYTFLDQYIHNTQFDEYDRLVQLCDTLADAKGFCLMEKRYVDVSIRRGVQPKTPLNWKAALENRAYFDQRTGGSVYRLLPGVIENTFGFADPISLNF